MSEGYYGWKWVRNRILPILGRVHQVPGPKDLKMDMRNFLLLLLPLLLLLLLLRFSSNSLSPPPPTPFLRTPLVWVWGW